MKEMFSEYNMFFFFSLQLLICFLPFSFILPRKKCFFRLLLISLAVYLLGCFVFWSLCYIFRRWYWWKMFSYLGASILLGVCICILFEINGWTAVAITTGTYASQHIAYQAARILGSFFPILFDPTNFLVLLHMPGYYVITAAAVFFLLIFPNRKKGIPGRKDYILIFLAVLSTSMMIGINFWFENRVSNMDAARLEYTVNSIYSIISCVLVLFLIFGLFRQNKLQEEKDKLNSFLNAEEKKHELSKELTEVINTKFHDLKHQLILFEKKTDNEEYRREIVHIKESISAYESLVDSGNATLDLVVSQKNMICEQDKIQFSYLLDGKLLLFMEPLDIAALFGNALDNAINYVKGVSMPEKRYISMRIEKRSEIVYVHLENYFSGKVEFKDGLPLSKGDDDYHGFGCKSMRNIVRKYKGEIYFDVVGNKFNMDVMFTPTENERAG